MIIGRNDFAIVLVVKRRGWKKMDGPRSIFVLQLRQTTFSICSLHKFSLQYELTKFRKDDRLYSSRYTYDSNSFPLWW